MSKKFDIPALVRKVSETLTSAGFENYLVGGCVRDLILGKEPKDWDITTNASPEEIAALFPKTFYENDFGTVGVVDEDTKDESLKVVEVTPYRLESGYSDFRRPDEVKWAKKLEEDLKRRDFTINALAYSVGGGEVVDIFGGREDARGKLIRAVGKPEERFGEDALRMLRALRLSAELGFAIEHETFEAISKHSKLLARISKERIRDEFIKIIMSENPATALELASRAGLLEHIVPELEEGKGMEQNKAHIYDVWEHLMRSLDHSAKKGYPLHVRLATLFHDIGKPRTRAWKGGQWTFYGHDVVGARMAKKILENLKFPKDTTEKVYKLVRWHMFFSETETITLSAVRRMVRNVGPDLIWDLMNVRSSDRTGMGRPKETTYRLRKYHSMIEEVMRDPISVKQLKIGGEEIMKLTEAGAGPHVGHMLEILLAEVLEEPKLNTKENLEKRVKELSSLAPDALAKKGMEAREKNAGEEEKETEKIREKYKVE